MTTKTAELIEYTNYEIRVWYDSNRYITGWESVNDSNRELNTPDSTIITIPWADRDMLNAFSSLKLSADLTTIAPDNSKFLNDIRESKKAQFSRECQDRILSGFDYTINGVRYHISYDQQAQTNFDSTYALFTQGITTTVQWTVTLGSSKTQVALAEIPFLQLYTYATLIKQYKVNHYREKLIPTMETIETEQELLDFTWDSVTPDPLPDIPEIDSNGDGEVSQEEFDKLVAQNKELQEKVIVAEETAKGAIARSEQTESALLDAINLIFDSMGASL